MTDKIKHEFKIEIEKSESGSLIRVTDVNPKSFDDAYVLANNLSRRAAELDIKLLDTERIRKAKDSVAFLWVTKGEGKNLSSLVHQRSHRIALSLLDAHPDGKTHSAVVRETGISKATVHTQLTGKIRTVAAYFTKRGNRYVLTDEGLEWVLREVIPFVCDASGKS